MDDLISRTEVIKAIRKCKFESDMPTDWYRGMECAQGIVDDVPSAEPTGDLISRAGAIEAMGEAIADGCSWYDALEALPSADAVDVNKAHEEEHLTIINRLNELQYAIAKTQTVVGKMVVEAEAVEGEWIPCSERLPKEKQEVYVTVYFIEGDTGRAYGYMDGFGRWHLYSTVEGTLNSGYEVIAWMPLPKPYEGSDDEWL